MVQDLEVPVVAVFDWEAVDVQQGGIQFVGVSIVDEKLTNWSAWERGGRLA